MSAPFDQSGALARLPGIRHGFFGRRGGVSTGDFASLNMSEAGGDKPANVARNRAAALSAAGFAAASLTLVRQIHSSSVVTLDAPLEGGLPAADALVTNVRGLTLGILTADCVPILLADAAAGVVGAAHAGWKGAIGGIAEATVSAMVALGADRTRIVAAIGPAISFANYEVGPEFAAELLARHGDAGNRIGGIAGGREHFDLPGFVFDHLHASGVAVVDDLQLCTYAEPRRFFSHRFATHRQTSTGRQLALIGLV